MQPRSSDFTYTDTSFARDPSVEGYFNCPILLPDGAVVTAFTGVIYDANGSDYTRCDLKRESMDIIPPSELMASTGTTGLAFNGGYVALTDDTVDYATIDNAAYWYFAECRIGATSQGVYGIVVEYTVSGLPVI